MPDYIPTIGPATLDGEPVEVVALEEGVWCDPMVALRRPDGALFLRPARRLTAPRPTAEQVIREALDAYFGPAFPISENPALAILDALTKAGMLR